MTSRLAVKRAAPSDDFQPRERRFRERSRTGMPRRPRGLTRGRKPEVVGLLRGWEGPVWEPSSDPIVFVVGAFAHGKVSVEYTEKMVFISNYPLSAALTCAKLTTAFEEVRGVI
ncbi:Ribosomal RNA small subunit methyltransferase NEP1 [Sciurus carolinensis]|uniref:Ribosomal RNA small subunit methyltransferase NEP1 n=1 Tax=Sciurus carolinensis TaxID=30640 RepID=A0AA41TC13_SCICA|nr:Ribosomal RNA small subunit methyltransferase NEP1 [Sciurus carolinensis]